MRQITTFEDCFEAETLLRRVFPNDPAGNEYRGRIYTSVFGGKVEFGHVKNQEWTIFVEEGMNATVFVSLRENRTLAYLCFVASNPDFKGMGYAKNLLLQVIDYLRDEIGVSKVTLTCYDHLVGYYTGLGFSDMGLKGGLHRMTLSVFASITAYICGENNPGKVVEHSLSRALVSKVRFVDRWDSADFIWKPTSRGVNRAMIERLLVSGGLVNHFPDSRLLTTKDQMNNLLHRNFDKSWLYSKLIPAPLQAGSDYPSEVFGERYWIAKPSGSYGGRDIQILDNMEAANRFSRGDYIIQKYLEKPLLRNNRKFDIRAFVLMTANQTLIYKHSYTRSCLADYDLASPDLRSHLTNTCYQLNFARTTEEIESLHESGEEYMSRLFPWMTDLAKWMSRVMHHKPACCFELFGVDIILDSNSRPWLLEINTNASLDMPTSLTKQFIPQLLDDLFQVVMHKKVNHKQWLTV